MGSTGRGAVQATRLMSRMVLSVREMAFMAERSIADACQLRGTGLRAAPSTTPPPSPGSGSVYGRHMPTVWGSNSVGAR